MNKTQSESTILRIHHGRLGHSDNEKTSLYGHITLHAMLSQSDKLTDTLSKEVHRLVNDLINHIGFANYYDATIRYETGFQIGLAIGYECSKI